MDQLLRPIRQFLLCDTPNEWIEIARRPDRLNELLIDHCNCELKAAQTAMYLMRKYAVDEQSAQQLIDWAEPYKAFIYNKQRDTALFLASQANKLDVSMNLQPKIDLEFGEALVIKMMRLIKEEFHHFYQVLEIMHHRGIHYQNITAGRYAKGLMKHVRTHEPAALVDKLIIGAYIEARSCERFAKLAPLLDAQLQKFYESLLRSEARHYQDYLALAQQISQEDISARVAWVGKVEAELILTEDDNFRFHSGVPSVRT